MQMREQACQWAKAGVSLRDRIKSTKRLVTTEKE